MQPFALEDLLEGAISVERGDGWVKPWRLPFANPQALPAGRWACSLRRGRRRRAAALCHQQPHLELTVLPVGQPRKFDLTRGRGACRPSRCRPASRSWRSRAWRTLARPWSYGCPTRTPRRCESCASWRGPAWTLRPTHGRAGSPMATASASAARRTLRPAPGRPWWPASAGCTSPAWGTVGSVTWSPSGASSATSRPTWSPSRWASTSGRRDPRGARCGRPDRPGSADPGKAPVGTDRGRVTNHLAVPREEQPNALGMSLGVLRAHLQDAVQRMQDLGDGNLFHLPGPTWARTWSATFPTSCTQRRRLRGAQPALAGCLWQRAFASLPGTDRV